MNLDINDFIFLFRTIGVILGLATFLALVKWIGELEKRIDKLEKGSHGEDNKL